MAPLFSMDSVTAGSFSGLTVSDSLRSFLLLLIGRDHEFALWAHLRFGDRALSLDHLVHHAFAESKATSDVGGSHPHLAEPEDLLFFAFGESESRLKHERGHCA